MYDQQLLDFNNKMTMLSLKKSKIESRSFMSAFAPEKPVKEVLWDIWFENNSFESSYNEILTKYYDRNFSVSDEKTVKKYYPTFSKDKGSILYEIGPKGKPETRGVTFYSCTLVNNPSKADFKEINEIKKMIEEA